MVIGSSSGVWESHGNVDTFGGTIKSSNNSSANPLHGGTSTSFGSPFAAFASAEQKSSAFGNASSCFGGSNFSVQNQGNPLQQSNFSFGTEIAAPLSESSVRKPFSRADISFGVSPTFGCLVGGNSSDRAPLSPASGASSTIFGVPNNSGFGFKSPATGFLSNSAHGSNSSTFGVSNEPPFAPGSVSKPSTCFNRIIGFPNTFVSEGFQASTTQGFGVCSTTSLWSTSASNLSSVSGPKSTYAREAPSTSNFSNLNNSGFHLSSTSASGNKSIFGIQSSSESQTASKLGSAVGNQGRGSGVASYSETREVDGTNNSYSFQKIQSISGMHFRDKSHEELRSEDNELCNKGGCTTWGGQSPGSACLKTTDTQCNIFSFPQLSNNSSVSTPFHPTSMPPTLGPSVNPFSLTNQYPYQSQTFIPQATVTSSMPSFTQNLNTSSLIPPSESLPKISPQHTISATFISPSAFTVSSSEPSSTISPSVQSTSVATLGHWSSTLNTSQPEQTAVKADTISVNNLSQPPQDSGSLTNVTETGSQNINGQHTVEMQSSLVANPFPKQSATDQPVVGTSMQYGICSMPVSDKLSPNRTTPLLRIRHVSVRHNRQPIQRHNSSSSKPKVPFFSNKEDGAPPHQIAPFLPRENPRAWITNSSFSRKEHTFVQEDSAPVTEYQKTAILAQMPKLPDEGYYTEPPIDKLAATERAEPGFCSRVNDFVVGRRGFGSIRFLGETDVRHLDLESTIQFNDCEVTVHTDDDNMKPSAGERLNKPAEVTLLNVKCINRNTGRQYFDGPRVDRFKEMLMKKAEEQGAEFVSYDPLQGEWKFRVNHF